MTRIILHLSPSLKLGGSCISLHRGWGEKNRHGHWSGNLKLTTFFKLSSNLYTVKPVFIWFDSLLPVNNLSVMSGQVFLGWTSTKLSKDKCVSFKDTTKWRRWGSNLRSPRSRVKHSTTELPLCSYRTCVKRPLSKRPKIGFQDQLLLRGALYNTFDLN